MSAPAPPPTPEAAPGSSRASQAALGVFLAVLLALLAYRGYGQHLGARPSEPAAPDLIDLNTATAAELAQVPGVGPKMAQAITDHRQTFGPFRSVEDLKNVRGVGPVTFDKVRHRLRAGNATASPQPPVEVTSTSFSSPLASEPPAPQLPPKPVHVAPAGGSGKKIQPGEPPINVNVASAEELQRLPGVGPVMSQAIVSARGAKPFTTVDDLDRVKGIGPKTLDRMRPFVTVR